MLGLAMRDSRKKGKYRESLPAMQQFTIKSYTVIECIHITEVPLEKPVILLFLLA